MRPSPLFVNMKKTTSESQRMQNIRKTYDIIIFTMEEKAFCLPASENKQQRCTASLSNYHAQGTAH